MSSKAKVLSLTAEELEEIERSCQVADPCDVMIEYLKIKIQEIKELIREYEEIKNSSHKVRSLARKRVGLAAKEVGAALNAPTKSTKKVIDADEEQHKKNMADFQELKNQAPIIVCK